MPSWLLGRIRLVKCVVGTSDSFFVFVRKFDSGVIIRVVIFSVLVSIIHSGILWFSFWVLVFVSSSGLTVFVLWISMPFLW